MRPDLHPFNWCIAWKRSYRFSVKFYLSSLQLIYSQNFGGSGSFIGTNLIDETHHVAALANKAHKKHVKAQFDKNFKPRVFSEGDLVLFYDQDSNKFGAGKFEPLWMGPYIVKRVLEKGVYELVYYDGIPLWQPWNGLYLKCCYA